LFARLTRYAVNSSDGTGDTTDTPVTVSQAGESARELQILMDPVLIKPAEHELDDVTTENVFDAALSVVLKVRPDKIND